MKKTFLSLVLATTAFAQTNVQKGAGNVLSNGSVVVGSNTSITATGTGIIAATSIPTLTINTTAPLTGGGALTGNLTLAIPAATGSVNGYLTSTDWTTFNAKQPAGNYITALTGDVTAVGPGSAIATLASVISASTVGSSTAIPVLTYDAKGRLTATTTAAVIAPAGTLTGTTLASNVVASSLTSVGTLASGTWNGTVISGQYGGTGVANTGKTITIGGNVTWSGAFTYTGTLTGNTSVTFPTSGTLATVAGTVSSITGTANQVIASANTGAVTLSLPQDIATTSAVTHASLSLGGTSGAGFLQIANQAGAPSTPTTAGRLYWDASNRLSWIGTNGFTRTFDGTSNTASRIYVLQDGAGTLLMNTNVAGTTTTNLNSITSTALAALTLGTGTFGTSVTFASATGEGTFAAANTVIASSDARVLRLNGNSATLASNIIIDFNNLANRALGAQWIANSSGSFSFWVGAGAVNESIRLQSSGVVSILNTTSSTNSTTGSLLIGNGSAATNVGIGGGNIFAGGTVNVLSTVDASAGVGAIITAGGIYAAKKIISGSTIAPVSHATSGGPTYVEGEIYYDTTLHKLRVGGASGWETITSI